MSNFCRQLECCCRHARRSNFNSALKWLMILAFFVIGQGCVLPATATTAPTITPATGVYSTIQPTATITGDPGATFRYTTDGTTPTLSSTMYSSPITIGTTATIKALASLSGVQSTVTTAYILNDPASLPVPRSGLQLWLLGDFGPIVSGSNVTRWSDLSGAGNNATQGTTANQPTLVTSSLNGTDVVNFNGANSYLTLTSGLNNLSTGASMYAVISPNSPTGAKTIYTSGAAGVTDMISLQTNGTTATANFNKGVTASNITTAAAAITTGKYQEIDVIHNGAASATIDVNASPVKTGVVQNLNTVGRTVNRLGVNSPF